jgi:hypothetical protein
VPDATLVIAGTGSDEPRLRAMTTELQLDGCVRFAGYVPEEQLWGMYASADVLAAPAMADFIIAPYEAMAMGCRAGGRRRETDPQRRKRSGIRGRRKKRRSRARSSRRCGRPRRPRGPARHDVGGARRARRSAYRAGNDEGGGERLHVIPSLSARTGGLPVAVVDRRLRCATVG